MTSPSVVTSTSSTSRPVRARIEVGDQRALGAGEQGGPGAQAEDVAHGVQPLGAGDGVDGLGVEGEQLGQRLGVRHRALLVGELLDPDGRLVEQLVGDPADGVQQLRAQRRVEVGQPGVEPGHLGLDHAGGHRPERDHRRA